MPGGKRWFGVLYALIIIIGLPVAVVQVITHGSPLWTNVVTVLTISGAGMLVAWAGSKRLLAALVAALGAGVMAIEDVLFRGQGEPSWPLAAVVMGSAFLLSFFVRKPAEKHSELLAEFSGWVNDLEAQVAAADDLLPDSDQYPTDLPERVPALERLLGGHGLFTRLEKLRPALQSVRQGFELELDETRDELLEFLDRPVHGAELEVPRRSVLMAFSSAEELEVETWLCRRYTSIVGDASCREEFPRTLTTVVELLGLMRDLCEEGLSELESQVADPRPLESEEGDA